MAKATTQIRKPAPEPEAEQMQAVGELAGALARHRKPLLQFLELLDDLQQTGILDIVQALLRNRHEIGLIGIAQLNKTGSQNIIKNGMGALQFVGKADPAGLETVMNGVLAGLERAGRTEAGGGKRLGLFEMLKMARSDEANASLRFLLNFAQGMGAEIRKSEAEKAGREEIKKQTAPMEEGQVM